MNTHTSNLSEIITPTFGHLLVRVEAKPSRHRYFVGVVEKTSPRHPDFEDEIQAGDRVLFRYVECIVVTDDVMIVPETSVVGILEDDHKVDDTGKIVRARRDLTELFGEPERYTEIDASTIDDRKPRFYKRTERSA